MLLIAIIAVVLTLILGYVNLCDNRETGFIKYLRRSMMPGMIVLILGVAAFGIVRSASYANYVRARTEYDSIIAQYRGAVQLYQDKAVINIEQAVTDFKFEGYQTAIANLIIDLRAAIVKYNKAIITKRVIAKSILFKGLIVLPDDDMVPINIVAQPDKE